MMHKGPGRCPLSANSTLQGVTVLQEQEEKRGGKTGSSWSKEIRMGQAYKYKRITKVQGREKFQKHRGGVAQNALGDWQESKLLKGPEC